MIQSHPDLDPLDTSMKAKILRVCKDEVDRTIAETICIRDARTKDQRQFNIMAYFVNIDSVFLC